MSKQVAVLDGGMVVNIENLQDDADLLENQVLYTADNPAYIGGDYVDGFFYPPHPFASWVRDAGVWVPPVAKPGDNYFWDEVAGNWVEVPGA
jgi:hypothetical protein